MQQIPVYAFTGFLDSGKTKFIQETLEDPRFNAGERTLLLIFEEGEEEYDFSTYPNQNVFLYVLDQQAVTTKELQALAKKHKVFSIPTLVVYQNGEITARSSGVKPKEEILNLISPNYKTPTHHCQLEGALSYV